jgi:hypothetical protein
MRAFVKLREMLASHRELARRLDEMEEKHDAQFKAVFDAIRELMTPPEKPRRRIGFASGAEKSAERQDPGLKPALVPRPCSLVALFSCSLSPLTSDH